MRLSRFLAGLRLDQLLFDFKRDDAEAAVAGAEQPRIDAAIMLNRADAVCRQAHLHALAEQLGRERAHLQIRIPAPTRLVVRVADAIAVMWLLAGGRTGTRHKFIAGLNPRSL